MTENKSQANDAAFDAMARDNMPPQNPDSQSNDPSARIAELEGDLRRAHNEVLKSQAEFENFRKRMRREMEEESRYAALPLIGELLPVIDNLERATQAATQSPTSADAAGLVDGVKLVIAQFEQALAKNGCLRIDPLGDEFDPHLHMAVMQEPSDEHAAGHVSRVLQSGYKLHDRVVRPAQVFVSTGPQ
jgi:molecular chaperone GrpE